VRGFLVTTIALMLSLSACVSTRPINEHYSRELDSVRLGMSRAQLRAILPNVAPRGQVYVDGETVEALELRHQYSPIGDLTIAEEQRLWFYFHGGKLVKWGQPNDWPQKPDLIIERRSR
jgi:hypothetical protein